MEKSYMFNNHTVRDRSMPNVLKKETPSNWLPTFVGSCSVTSVGQAFRRNPDVAGFFILRSDNLSDAEKAQKLEKLFALMDADTCRVVLT
eukprot:5992082-Amphidinium_carterae.1